MKLTELQIQFIAKHLEEFPVGKIIYVREFTDSKLYSWWLAQKSTHRHAVLDKVCAKEYELSAEAIAEYNKIQNKRNKDEHISKLLN